MEEEIPFPIITIPNTSDAL